MTWRDFEILVGEYFRRQGFEVTDIGDNGPGPDGGIDLVLKRGAETFFVQCKQWKSFRVGVKIVRELKGVMAAKGANGGYVVTSGTFSDEAQRFARGANVTLINGDGLFSMIKAVRTNPVRNSHVPRG